MKIWTDFYITLLTNDFQQMIVNNGQTQDLDIFDAKKIYILPESCPENHQSVTQQVFLEQLLSTATVPGLRDVANMKEHEESTWAFGLYDNQKVN